MSRFGLKNLERDHEFLLHGDVFTRDVISTWIWYKREKEVDAIRLWPQGNGSGPDDATHGNRPPQRTGSLQPRPPVPTDLRAARSLSGRFFAKRPSKNIFQISV